MSALNHAHQMEVFDPMIARPVTLLGAGAVGSTVATMLPKLGVTHLTVYDNDFVASHNIPMSAYRDQHDIGHFKADALKAIVFEQSGLTITAHRAMYEGEPLTTPAVISCVDLMGNKDELPLRGRRLIWSKVRKNPRVELFLDTRTAGGYIEVYAVEPSRNDDIARYESVLFDDKEGTVHSCGHHGVIFGSMIAAAVVAANLSSFWSTGTKKWRFAFKCDTLQPV